MGQVFLRALGFPLLRSFSHYTMFLPQQVGQSLESETKIMLFRKSGSIILFFPCSATALLGPSPPNCEASRSHTFTHIHTHPIGLLWTSDQLVAEAATYTTQQTQKTNIHALSRIRTSDRSNRAAAELHEHRDGHRTVRVTHASELYILEITTQTMYV